MLRFEGNAFWQGWPGQVLRYGYRKWEGHAILMCINFHRGGNIFFSLRTLRARESYIWKVDVALRRLGLSRNFFFPKKNKTNKKTSEEKSQITSCQKYLIFDQTLDEMCSDHYSFSSVWHTNLHLASPTFTIKLYLITYHNNDKQSIQPFKCQITQ